MGIKYFSFAVIVLALCTPNAILAATYKLDRNSDIVGEIQYYTVQKGDTISSIARKFDMGYIEMVEANPEINPNKLTPGTQLLIPSEFILPNAPRQGVVLNVAELRVYYFPADQDIVVTHPVGLGQEGWRTPVGETSIVRKRANPTWTPPPSIHAEARARGRSLPAVVPAGPNNPLGLYAMNLGWQNYLMHGTNNSSSVGKRSSHGCIRMYAEDIENLFNAVEVGTPVTVVHEPFKIGVKNGQLYLEAHEPFPDKYYNFHEVPEDATLEEVIYEEVTPEKADPSVDWGIAKKLINDTYGYPVPITSVIITEDVNTES